MKHKDAAILHELFDILQPFFLDTHLRMFTFVVNIYKQHLKNSDLNF